jgi:uncharacterized membrane protein
MLPAQLVAILIVVVLGLLFWNLIFDVLSPKLGLPSWATFLVLAGSAVGSLINIPIWRRELSVVPGYARHVQGILYFIPPRVTDQVIAINVGGAVIPILLSIWLLPRAPLVRTVIATAVVAAVAHVVATPVAGRGIEMPIWVAPVVAALLGLVLTFGRGAAPLAYIAGSMGVLIGADLLNLGRLASLGPGVLSIGGAGVFDGVFLVGIVAALISFDRPRKPSRPAFPRSSPASWPP